MKETRTLRTLRGLLLGTFLLVGCQSRVGEHHYCTSDSDCVSRLCIDTRCHDPCADDSDCGDEPEATACGRARPDALTCVAPCESEVHRMTCVDGVSVSCALVDDPTRCATCDCPAGYPRCEPGIGCFPPGEVGDSCEEDNDCWTLNCSRYEGVCRVRVGAECTPENCDICGVASDGYSFCSRECDGASGCGGMPCVSSPNAVAPTCRPPCAEPDDPWCTEPLFCGRATNDLGEHVGPWFCACTEPDGCGFEPRLRELGDPCRADSHCESETCVGIDASWSGTCAAPCVGDGDCWGGTRCAIVACPEGATDHCGALCLRPCTEAPDVAGCNSVLDRCHALASPDGGTVTVCDPPT